MIRVFLIYPTEMGVKGCGDYTEFRGFVRVISGGMSIKLIYSDRSPVIRSIILFEPYIDNFYLDVR